MTGSSASIAVGPAERTARGSFHVRVSSSGGREQPGTRSNQQWFGNNSCRLLTADEALPALSRNTPLWQQAGRQEQFHRGFQNGQRSQRDKHTKHGLRCKGSGYRCREPVDKPLSVQLRLNGLVGAGFLAEPGLEEILGQSAQSFRVLLSVDIALEAFNLKGLHHGELDRGHRLDAMGQAEAMAFHAPDRHLDYRMLALSAATNGDYL